MKEKLQFKNWPVKVKLIIVSLSLLVVPLLTLGILSYNAASNGLNNEITNKLVEQVSTYNNLVKDSFAKLEYYKGFYGSYLIDARRNVMNILYYQGKRSQAEIIAFQKNVNEDFQKLEDLFPFAEEHGINYSAFEKSLSDYKAYLPRLVKGEITEDEVKVWSQIGVKVVAQGAEFAGEVAEARLKDDIRTSILSVKVGKTGYMYVMDSNGVLQIHPTSEGKSLASHDFCQEMMAKKNGYTEYFWEGRKKIVAFSYYPEQDWVIASGSYFSDFSDGINRIRNAIVLVVLLALVAGTLLTLWLAKKITDPLLLVAHQAEKVGQGDLTCEELNIDSQDEIGQLAGSFNFLTRNLREMVNQMKLSAVKLFENVNSMTTLSKTLLEGSDSLASSSSESSSAVEEMSHNIREVLKSVDTQTSAVTETSAAVEEMTRNVQNVNQSVEDQSSSINESTAAIEQMASSIKQIALNSSQVNNIAQELNMKAKDGDSAVKEAVEGMKEISSSSEQISNIIGVITGIASQTNLLALNAAIEAARAGEAGKGFAVVADEVRNLAEQSAQAAQEITDLINNANEKAQVGVKRVEDVNEIIADMTTSIEEVGRLIEEVTRATNEQQTGAEEISSAMENLNSVTQGILTATNEQSKGAQEISTAMQNVAKVSEEISAAMDEQSKGTTEVASAVEIVSKIADENKHGAEEFVGVTDQLSQESHTLEEIVSKFQI